MPQTTRILEDLRERYGELRGLERRSDDLLKQVIDRFYVIEGLNRLQTELDCLDMLVMHKTNATTTNSSSVSNFGLEPTELSKNHSKSHMLKSLYTRSKRATMSALSLLKLTAKRENCETKIAGDELRKITRLQRAKLSELMTTVRSSIVTNYGVLEQLQQLYEMHEKNMALWQRIRNLAESVLPTPPGEVNDSIEVVQAVNDFEQKCKIDEVAMGEGIILAKVSTESLLQRAKLELRPTNSSSSNNSKCPKTSHIDNLYECNNSAIYNSDGAAANVGDGDGQSALNSNAMTQTSADVKPTNSSQTLCASTTETDARKPVHSIKKNLKSAFSKGEFF